jgi:hypothetical protein
MGVSINGVPPNGWFIMENAMKIWMIWRYFYFRKLPYLTKRYQNGHLTTQAASPGR